MNETKRHNKTENKLVPQLRFKEFEGEFSLSKLGDELNLFNGYAFSSKDSSENGVRWVKIADVGINKMKLDAPSFLPSELKEKHSKFLLNKGDYVVALTRPILGGKLKIARINNDFDGSLLNQRVGKLESKNDLEYMYCMLQQKSLISRIENRIAGTDPPNLSPNEIATLKTHIPSLPEQQKIASFLSAVDEKIQQLTKKAALLEQYKKGVMQQLFSGHLRFRDENGNEYPDWEEKRLGEFLFEHKLKSTGKEEVFSVSVHKGLVNQIEHLGRVFAAKNTSNYNLVQPNDIVYTKSPTGDFPLGIIKQSKIRKSVIVSPLYGIFTPETPGLGYMLNVFFESPINTQNYLASIIQKGAKNTINITNATFLSKKLKVPVSKHEQQNIGDYLSSIDTKIEAVNNQITQTQTFKKGLLQQMFV